MFLPRPAARPADIARALRAERATYTANGDRPAPRPGFREDKLVTDIGDAAIFDAAVRALGRFEHYPSFTTVHAPHRPPREGDTFVTEARHLGFSSVNPCRVHAVETGDDRFAFAFHTLEGHAEQGEERFSVERIEGRVVYTIHAISRPTGWIARLGSPVARVYQRRFQRESIERMCALSLSG